MPEGIRLGTATLVADPNPGSALDCLPENGAIGSFMAAGRFEEAAAVARRAVAHLAAGTEPLEPRHDDASLANILGFSGIGTGSEELERALEEGITLAHSVSNPTVIAYAYWVACSTATTDPARLRAAAEMARAYASEVDNRWLLTMAAAMIAAGPGTEPDDTAMAVAFDAAEDLHRTGWSTHAWWTMWGTIAGLFDLGHIEAAAMVLGGCESSGVSRMAFSQVPAQIEDDSLGTASFRRLGAQLAFDDLLAVAAGRRELPLLP